MAKGIRFRPPRMVVGAELEWVLSRALGGGLQIGGLDGELCADLADRLGVLARVGGLVGQEELEEELGAAAAARFRGAYRLGVGGAMYRETVCREMAELLAAAGIRSLFLKGAAMMIGGYGASGLRSMCDTDLLVANGEIDRAAELLVGAGWRMGGCAAAEHQLPPMAHPSGSALELHRMVRGVELAPGRAASLEDVEAAGLGVQIEGWPPGAMLPDRHFMTANALVHGIAQHGLQPQGYPLLRMLADLQDLDRGEELWREFMGEPFTWIRRSLSVAEASAARELMLRMAAGRSAAAIAAGDDGAALLLRHVLAGSFDEAYQRSLRFQKLARPLGGGSRLRSFAILLRNNLWMERHAAEARYGKPRNLWQRATLRLRRPAELAGQVMRSLEAWLRLRRRDR